MLFFKSINITSYYALTNNADAAAAATSTGSSYRGRFDYNADRYGATAEHMLIDRDFRPEVGYVRRTDIRRSFGQVRFSPRPRAQRADPQVHLAGQHRLRDRRAGASSCRAGRQSGLFRIEFQSSDQFSTEYSREYRIAAGPFSDCAGRDRAGGRVRLLDRPRVVLARSAAPRVGTFQRVNRHAVRRHEVRRLVMGRWGVVPQFSLEPSVTLAWGSLPYGDFTARLIGSRFTVTPSARMQISSLVQFNVDAGRLTSSARLRWEYTGGSELFVVYSDGRDTRSVGLSRVCSTAPSRSRRPGCSVLEWQALQKSSCLAAALPAPPPLCSSPWGHAVQLVTRPHAEHGLAVSLPPSCAKLFDAIGVSDAIDRAGFMRSTGNTVWWGERRRARRAIRRRRARLAGRVGALCSAARSRDRRRRSVERRSSRPIRRQPFVLDCTGRGGVIARDEGAARVRRGPRTIALVGAWRRDGRLARA